MERGASRLSMASRGGVGLPAMRWHSILPATLVIQPQLSNPVIHTHPYTHTHSHPRRVPPSLPPTPLTPL